MPNNQSFTYHCTAYYAERNQVWPTGDPVWDRQRYEDYIEWAFSDLRGA